jgi:hypothetical protein
VVKLADFGPLGHLGCARAPEACIYSAPEVLRKVREHPVKMIHAVGWCQAMGYKSYVS